MNFLFRTSLFFAFFSCFAGILQAQTTDYSPKIRYTRAEMQGDSMIIRYELFNSHDSQVFRVWVEARRVAGEDLPIRHVSGDVGENIRGGKNKRIVWHITDDMQELDAMVNVVVKAEMTAGEFAPKVVYNDIGYPKALLFSAACPGLGNTMIRQKKPYWLVGIVGYSCLTSALVLNRKAITNYDQYLESDDIYERANLYDDWNRQRKMAKFMGYTAAAIWLADLAWTGINAQKARKQSREFRSLSWKIVPDFDFYSQTPGISLQLRF